MNAHCEVKALDKLTDPVIVHFNKGDTNMFDAQHEAHKAARKHKTDRQVLRGVAEFDRQAADESLVQASIENGWSDAQLDLARRWLQMTTGVTVGLKRCCW